MCICVVYCVYDCVSHTREYDTHRRAISLYVRIIVYVSFLWVFVLCFNGFFRLWTFFFSLFIIYAQLTIVWYTRLLSCSFSEITKITNRAMHTGTVWCTTSSSHISYSKMNFCILYTFRYNNIIGLAIATVVASGGQRIAVQFNCFEYRSDSSIVVWWSIVGNQSVHDARRYCCICWTVCNEQVEPLIVLQVN